MTSLKANLRNNTVIKKWFAGKVKTLWFIFCEPQAKNSFLSRKIPNMEITMT